MSEANTTEGRRSNRKFAPATGIQSDFEKILSLFVESKSVRYEEFAKIWREKKLSLICAGRQSDRETVEFMEECMKVAFKMFMPPYGFQARAGALYLLYGLYNTQPCLPKVKIRVTHADWEHIKTLQTELKKQGHHDTNFILQKMIACGAFHFCAHSDEARGRYTLADDANKAMMDALREDKQRIDELFGEETMDQLERVHRQYHQIKVLLAGPDANRPDRSLDVLHDKFPDMITEALQKHHDNWNEKDSTRKGRGNNSLPTIAEHSEPEDIDTDPDYQPNATLGQRRAELKAVAFRGAKSKQRYKHRKIATESSSDLSSSSPKKKRGRPRGGKPVQPIGRATLSTVPEEGDSTRATGIPLSEDGFLHMPQLEEAEITKPGDKSKNQTDEQSSKSGKKISTC